MKEITLSATIRRTTFRDEKDGFTVASATTSDGKSVTIVGEFPFVPEGVEAKFVGRWTRHPKYGERFQASAFETEKPKTGEGAAHYLAAAIKGIGEKQARAIVDRFGGEEAVRILEEEPERLLEVKGIGKKKLEAIKSSRKETADLKDVLEFLHAYSITAKMAKKIVDAYGAGAVAKIKARPYSLCEKVRGIGFAKADEMARAIGVAWDDPSRIEAGVLRAMEVAAERDGHVGLTREEAAKEAGALLHVEPSLAEDAIGRLTARGALVEERGIAHLPRYLKAEKTTAQALAKMIADGPVGKGFSPTPEQLAKYDPEQIAATDMATTYRASVVTGGPGVGKTTVVNEIADTAEKNGMETFLAAPTGRAAKRLEQATGRPASTLHRALEYSPATGFQKNAKSKLPTGAYVVDEASMLDCELAAAFVSALDDRSFVTFVGDVDQLPSVGPGRTLGDLIDSGVVPTTRLERVHRQDGGSGIISNARRVNAGRPPLVDNSRPGQDFFFVRTNDGEDGDEPEEDVARYVTKIVSEGLNGLGKKLGIGAGDVQVLTPQKTGETGRIALNARLQEALNPDGEPIAASGGVLRVGDRVAQTKNDYQKEAFNGDVGTIARAKRGGGAVVDFDGREVEYEADELGELELAYASTVHKSQGSEYPAVVAVMTRAHSYMAKRNLLYTAITRAKRACVIVGSTKTVAAAARTVDANKRLTVLARELREAVEEEAAAKAGAAGDVAESAAESAARPDAEEEARAARLAETWAALAEEAGGVPPAPEIACA